MAAEAQVEVDRERGNRVRAPAGRIRARRQGAERRPRPRETFDCQGEARRFGQAHSDFSTRGSHAIAQSKKDITRAEYVLAPRDRAPPRPLSAYSRARARGLPSRRLRGRTFVRLAASRLRPVALVGVKSSDFPTTAEFSPRPTAWCSLRAEGLHVVDSEGRRYLDATSGAFCVQLGYTRSRPGLAP